MNLFGVDVSSHNGDIAWNRVASTVDFAMIRAGYGKNNIDKKAVQNVKGCQDNGIPFGLYWFSYAYTPAMAEAEASYLCDFADKYFPTYPLVFDYEYDSDKYANSQGKKLSNGDKADLAREFLRKVEARGYYAALYSNIDYLNAFASLRTDFDLWLAEWGKNSPSLPCGMWQKSSKGQVSGITGNVDTNIAYKNYPEIIGKKSSTDIEEAIKKYVVDRYIPLAEDIILGKYGNGTFRKDILSKLGYDYSLAQFIVNRMVK